MQIAGTAFSKGKEEDDERSTSESGVPWLERNPLRGPRQFQSGGFCTGKLTKGLLQILKELFFIIFKKINSSSPDVA